MSDLVERLNAPIRWAGTTSEDSRPIYDELHLEAASEIKRLTALLDDKLADVRLVRTGPAGGSFQFDLEGGPIPYIAEYLFQMLRMRDEGAPPSNYVEIGVNHLEFGECTLTLQRRSGQTPHQLRQAAEKDVERLTAENARLRLALAEADRAPPPPEDEA